MDMLAKQLSQIATSINEMRGNDGKIPATVKMPGKENISQITLRSGKAYEGPSRRMENREPSWKEGGTDGLIKQTEQAGDSYELRGEDLMGPLPQMTDPFFLNQEPEVATEERMCEEKEQEEGREEKKEVTPESSKREVPPGEAIPLQRGGEKEKGRSSGFYGNLCQFIKEFIAGKAQSDGKIVIGENVSAVIQKKKLPSKRTDPGMFTLPITIGDVKVEHAICDLGASINVLPYSVYTRLVGARLVQTKVVNQLADRPCINPVGVLENVIVKVHDFLYPADFHVIKMSKDSSAESTEVVLGRPFLQTAKTMIDVYEGIICLDYHGVKYTFSIDEAMKKPMDVENLHSVDVIAPLVQEYLEEEFLKEKFESATRHNGIEADVANWCEAMQKNDLTDQEISEVIMDFCQTKESDGSSHPTQLASVEKASEQESQPDDEANKNPLPQGERSTPGLKKLPPGLKYAYLGEEEAMSVIINSQLTQEQEEKLMKVLERNQKAIGWKLSDLVGISPDLCMHHIRLEEGAKAYRDPQRKLNPHMREEVLKEVLKLVSLGIIYSVPDSKWVSPVHMVPKKSGIQVVTNAKNELVPTRLVTGWRMCIVYRKLNAAMKKDHFPLPFIDQMLERIPFGLCIAPGTFQRCMMSIFSDLLEECIEIFMDDFIVYGDTFEKCLHNLDLVLERCRKKSLVLNFEKCHFMVTEGIVLGHVVSERGIQVDQAKVDVIAKLPHPTNQKIYKGLCEDCPTLDKTSPKRS
ncbi:hypothetical protein AAHA92_05430 [Salvia divinorum]|uniref:Reverse transcriptase domain-containing protein n=1 Tax=Salvia divinorum TaxID=28513 RepID=A0ABD1I4Z1_SALDI